MPRTIFVPGEPIQGSTRTSSQSRDNFTALYEGDIKPLRVTQQTSPGMTVQVEADEGRTYVNGNLPINFAGGNSPTFVEPALGGYKRIDVLTLDSTGTLNITSGLASAGTPASPTYPANELPLAEIYLRNGMSSIKNLDDATNGYIIPRQPIFNLGDSAIGEGHINICPVMNDAVVGTWTINVDTACLMNGGYFNSSAAVNDSTTYKVFFEVGTYVFKLIAFRNTNRGIMTVKINGGALGTTIDMYGSTARNIIYSITGITIANRGLYDLELVALSKNASSSSYGMYIQAISLYRTA